MDEPDGKRIINEVVLIFNTENITQHGGIQMGIMSSEWRGRLQHWMRTLKDDFYRPLGEISWEAFRTMDHLSREEAMNGPFEPVEPGFTWGKTWNIAGLEAKWFCLQKHRARELSWI